MITTTVTAYTLVASGYRVVDCIRYVGKNRMQKVPYGKFTLRGTLQVDSYQT